MKFGLGLKIALFTSALILFIGVGLFGVVVYEERVTIHDLRMKESLETARKTSSLIENHLYNLDVRQLRRVVSSVVEGGGVDLVWVLDDQGRLITDGSDRPALRNQKPPVPFIDALIAAKAELRDMDETYHWAGTPVVLGDDTVLGYSVVAFTHEYLDERLRFSLRTQLLVLGPALLIGVLAAFFFGRRIARPVEAVTAAAEQVGAGNWNVTIDIDSKDEVGDLARTINAMAENLSQIAVSRDNLESIVQSKTAELNKHRENLEELVDERTRELLLAKEEADSASKAKSEFLSSMSHELRTPLNAILGFAQILELNQKQLLTEDQSRAVHQIKKGGAHLLELINDVLNLAKIETKGLELSMENVGTHALINECVPVAEALARDRGVTIEVRDCSNAVVWADYTRLKQVVLNLMSNAVKYNREGGTVSVTCEEVSQDMLRISISDTGNGIAADKQEELFQPFSRLGQENSNIEGTGIGLVITKRLIEGMGGNIGFESTLDVGSTFWVEVPLSGERSVSPSDIAKEAGKATKIVSKAKGRILYIEDNPDNIALMEIILENIPGYELHTAQTAELGLVMALKDKPDLVLMDINLPGMNGIEALGELRRQKETRDIPAIAISAAATVREVERGLEAGFLAYITKPFDIQEMLHTIEGELLDRDARANT